MEDHRIDGTNGSYSWFEPSTDQNDIYVAPSPETDFDEKVKELKLVLDGLCGINAYNPNVDSYPWGMEGGYKNQ
jgi:hypothetical protein